MIFLFYDVIFPNGFEVMMYSFDCLLREGGQTQAMAAVVGELETFLNMKEHCVDFWCYTDFTKLQVCIFEFC